MRQLIDRVWQENNYIKDLSVRFDYLKHEIMLYSIEYCKKRAKEKKLAEREITTKLEIIDKTNWGEVATDDDMSTFEQLKQSLENITEENARVAWIRFRLEFIENAKRVMHISF